MNHLTWDSQLERALGAYVTAVYRPELPASERIRGARSYLRIAESFRGEACATWLAGHLTHADTQVRNTAARLLSGMEAEAAREALVDTALSPEHPWVHPGHLLRVARRRGMPARYVTAWRALVDELQRATFLGALLAQESIEIERKGKTRSKKKGGRGKHGRRAKVMRAIDIRPMLARAEVQGDRVQLDVVTVDGRPGKVREYLAMLTANPERVRVLKRDTMVLHEGAYRSMAEAWNLQAVG